MYNQYFFNTAIFYAVNEKKNQSKLSVLRKYIINNLQRKIIKSH